MKVPNGAKPRSSESGMTIIELAIAGCILVFGMLSIMGLLAVSIGNNGRSKIDSTATMLSQAVIEQITASMAGGGPDSIKDCVNATPWTIGYNTGAGSSGAPLNAQGNVDFTQAQVTDYSMNYVDCSNNVQTTYDVRWNIQAVGANGTFLLSVGARPIGGLPSRFAFAIPVNMRVYVATH